MASFHAGRSGAAARQAEDAHQGEGAGEDMLAPIIAGAYARGVAETLDLLGVPGLFLDASGEVLFASRAAAPLLRGRLRLHMNHLVAERAEDNRRLEGFIAEAVGADAGEAAVHLSGAGLELRRLPNTKATALPGQRLRAVLLLAEAAKPEPAAPEPSPA